ncbi:MAG TPA: ribonuclease R, partial [Pseudomonadales bacterium]|nr:ribonuclease R [Pseudomonadales bacterium]
NNRICTDVLVTGERVAEAKPGQIVVVQIVEQPSIHSLPTGTIAEILGDHLTPDMEVEIALRNNDIPVNWPDEVIEAVDRMPIEVKEGDKANRKDLRQMRFVTIDGEDARDFDDAVYCEARPSGWRLYVAIADVSHYVEIGTPLDQSAFERGTSVYFPQYVVPMLPEKLSNGLCSLNPAVDRLVLVCEMTISSRGRVGSYRFYEGLIHSHARLTYTRVARMIEGDVDKEVAHVKGEIDELHNLYRVLLDRREERGALDFESTELGFLFGEDGRVTGIQPRHRNTAHRIIEECMLCANVSAARFIGRHKRAGLYRVHEPPEMEKVEYLREFLARFGLDLGGGEMPAPSDLQVVIDQLRTRKNGHVLQMAVLRAMQQAVYQPDNKGHYGLNYREYTHFTSPIRRYPDLLVHRFIKSVIHSREDSTLVERFGKPRSVDFYPYEMDEAVMMGEHCSFAERRADTAVYDVLEWIKCDYVSDRVGDIVEGVITAVTKFGFFVELLDLYVEGLVHVSTLGGDYFEYDQESQALVGERSRHVYGMGDAVSVQIARVNVEERKIDFELVTHSPLSRQRPHSRRKGKSTRRDQNKRGGRSGGGKGRRR